MIRSDFHMHTAFSGDCDVPARKMVEGAMEKGLKTICITDHMTGIIQNIEKCRGKNLSLT